MQVVRYRTYGHDQLRPDQQQNFSVSVPLGTHWRVAACKEVDCPHYLLGWRTIVPAESEQAQYLRTLNTSRAEPGARRRFTESRSPVGTAIFTFPPGHKCFRPHKTQTGRPAEFLRSTGPFTVDDLTGATRGPVTFYRPTDWVDLMDGELYKIGRDRQRG